MPKNPHNSSLPLYARVLIGAGVGLGALLGVGWYYADGLVHVRPVRRPVYKARVLAIEEGHGHIHLTLTRTPSTLRPGVITLDWEVGGRRMHAQLGPPLSESKQSGISGKGVVREVRWQQAPLQVGQPVRASTIGHGQPRDHGLPQQDVTVPSEHGPMPAWLVPATGTGDDGTGLAGAAGSDWVIVTHGYGGLRQDALRILPTFHRLGLSSLTITFRNAEGAPRTPQKVLRLSAEEWQDLENAVEYAYQNGARRVLLFGFSMGGSISLAFLRYSKLASRVVAVMLDSPAMEWRSLITHHAYRYRLPIPLVLSRIVAWLTVFKSKQDFDAVDHLSVMDSFDKAMLVFHGSVDNTVPIAQVEKFVHARPDIVEYHRVEGGQHTRPWNIDPERYEAAVETFVKRVLAEPSAPAQATREQAVNTTGSPRDTHHVDS